MSRSTILLLTSALLSASLIAQDTAPAPQLLAQTGRAADKKAAPAGGDATEPAVTATPTPAARRNARSTPAPAPGAVPEATPEPKRPGFFERGDYSLSFQLSLKVLDTLGVLPVRLLSETLDDLARDLVRPFLYLLDPHPMPRRPEDSVLPNPVGTLPFVKSPKTFLK